MPSTARSMLISTLEPTIHAWAYLDHERARREAAEAAMQGGSLLGLVAGIKDIFDTADQPSEYGSPIYAGHQPLADASAVALLASRRGSLHRENGDIRVRLRPSGTDGQPAPHDTYAGRLVDGLGGGRRCRHGGLRYRHTDRRFDHQTGELLWRVRLQTDFRERIDCRC